jgi:hypothetical protein
VETGSSVIQALPLPALEICAEIIGRLLELGKIGLELLCGFEDCAAK